MPKVTKNIQPSILKNMKAFALPILNKIYIFIGYKPVLIYEKDFTFNLRNFYRFRILRG